MHGDLAGAEAAYRRALEVDPTWWTARIGLAEVALSRGDLRAVRTELEAAIPSSREPVERIAALRMNGWAAALNRDAAALRRYMTQAAAMAEGANLPATARDIHFHLAMAEMALGNAAQAEAAFQAATKMAPANPYQGNYRITLAALTNDAAGMQEAVAEIEKAAAAPDAPALVLESVPFTRSIRASATADFTTARAELARVENESMHMLASAFLARALQKQGDAAGAKQARSAVDAYNVFDANHAFAVMILGK
jgi:tetratricopeptide (TPR) repeat protein